MSVRMNAYQFLVNRVPAIQKEYWRRRKLHKSPVQRAGDWIALLGMNLAWRVGYRSWAADEWNPDARRVLPQAAESSLDRKLPPEELAKKLLTYDVISFDIFDTLIFRPFEKPTDLFHMVGESWVIWISRDCGPRRRREPGNGTIRRRKLMRLLWRKSGM